MLFDTVLAPNQALSDSARFELRDSNGRVLRSGRFYGSQVRPLKVPPGTYRLRVSDADSVLMETSIELGSETELVPIGG